MHISEDRETAHSWRALDRVNPIVAAAVARERTCASHVSPLEITGALPALPSATAAAAALAG